MTEEMSSSRLAPRRELEVAMLWDEVLLDVRHFRPGEEARIGSEPGNHFDVRDPRVGLSFALARCDATTCQLALPPASEVTWSRDGTALEEIPDELESGDQVEVRLSRISFRIRWVAPAARARPELGSRDFGFARLATTSLMAGAALVLAILLTDTEARALSEDVFGRPPLVVHGMGFFPKKPRATLPLPEKPLAKPTSKGDASGGARASTSGGRQQGRDVGLVALLGDSGSTHGVFAPGGLGGQLDEAIASIGSDRRRNVADSSGIGGMASRSLGPGGGDGRLGLNGIGAGPGGRGGIQGVGFSLGHGDGHRAGPALPPTTILSAGCDKAVIARVISRHANEVRYCYETALSKDPELGGKVMVSFTIEPSGEVGQAQLAQSTVTPELEQCVLTRVRRWRFPEPKGGGVCVINYPWLFNVAGAREP